MAAQAGWYEAPGEPGMLRYWSGDAWTESRQPAPPVGAPVVAATPSWTDQTIAQSAVQPVAQPAYAGAAQYGTAPAFVPTPLFAPQSAGSGPSLPPVGSAPAESRFQHFVGEARTAALNPANQGLAEELGGAALAADGVVGFGPNRQGIGGAIKGMFVGLLFVVIGLVAISFLGAQGSVGAGEAKVPGVVTSVNSSTSTDSSGSSSTSCTPLAKFAVGGKSYQAGTSIGVSPCGYQVGQSVDVIYTKADPSTSHVVVSSGPVMFLWIFPIVGLIAFFGSLWTFIKRAGSIAGGIALIFNGRKRRAASLQQR